MDLDLGVTWLRFLLDIHVVVEQLLSWPPAWPGVSEVLSSRHEWTKHYCDKILGESPIWPPDFDLEDLKESLG